MTLRRWMWIFVVIGLASLALAGAGRWWLQWPANAVRIWLGIGASYLLGAALLLLVPRWWREHCDEMYAQPAARRYLRALWPILIGTALTLSLSITLIQRGIESLPLRALVAVLPTLPILLLLRATLRCVREIDEMQRRIETEAIGIASLLLSLLYTASGLLQKAKVIDLDAGLAMILVFPLLCLAYGVARMLLTRRYL